MNWARSVGDHRFEPARWGTAVFQLEADDGAHLLVRSNRAAELSLWLPDGLAPAQGEHFGLYIHPDRNHADRIGAAAQFRRAIGFGQPLRPPARPDNHRMAAMLLVYDSIRAGRTPREIAGELFDPMPDDWRSSAERADLARLIRAGAAMVAGQYRDLLRPRKPVRTAIQNTADPD